MNYEKIRTSLNKVLSLLDDCERDGLSAVEYDLILRELRDSYSDVRFGCKPCAAAVAEPVRESDKQDVHEPEPVVELVATASVEDAPNSEVAENFEQQNRRRMFVHSLYNASPAEPVENKPSAAEPEQEVPENTAAEDTIDTPETECTVAEDAAAPEPAECAETETETEPETECESASEDEHTETIEETAESTEVEYTVVAAEPAEPTNDEEPAQTPEQPAAEIAEQSAQPEAETTELNDKPQEAAFESAEPVLGEVINADVQTFADTIAPAESAVADVVGKDAINSLTEAIGINDRFLLIRDLFHGDADAYSAAVETLDSFDNLEDCLVHIVEHYDWNPHCDGAALMMSLLERRYGRK